MPRFKHPKTGDIVEVAEEFANQVLRPQGKYTEVFETEAPKEVKEPAEVVAPKNKKSKKKTLKKGK